MRSNLLAGLGLTKKHFIFFALVAAITFSGVYVVTSSAFCYGGSLMGRTCYRGYFSNTYDQWGDNVLPEIKNGQALPSTDVYNAKTFYDFLRAAYFSGDPQRRTGAAFIYNTLEGHDAPGVGRNISEAQWQRLFNKLNGLDTLGKITWHGNVSADTNSYWQGPDTNDDAYYGEFKNESGILIRDYNNNVVYRLLRRCANPVGAAYGLPDPQNYTLTPRVDETSVPDQIESKTRVNIRTTVNNVGNVESQPTQWEITQINVQPGKKAPHEDEGPTVSGEAPCQSNGGAPAGNYFTSSDATCKNIAKGNAVFSLASPANPRPRADNVDVGDLPVGTRVCFALSVQPRSNLDASWAHSKPICTVVGKEPKVQIWGGDIKTRGKIETSTSVRDTQIFGSWVEYGAFSVGENKDFASGSGLVNQSLVDQREWSKLTFANINDTGNPSFGHFTLESLPTVAGFFDSSSNKQPVGSAEVNLATILFRNGNAMVVRTADDLKITRSDIPATHSVVVVAEGDITIDEDITYANSPFSGVNDIPQVVLVAKGDINIKGSVKHLDAWLIAGDTIDTCYEVTGNLTAITCADRLEVNGPVVTNHLLLKRTGGSGTGAEAGDPAERFNLRPDAYLWANLQARGSNKAQTVHTVELPPRF
ncbi:MAG TPA: hypothetical protein VFT59_03115 [Candidatus Saccharimonadales bacterium]|nr:hypothetical protein [Candidatus Saccharimonadales bacterium]